MPPNLTRRAVRTAARLVGAGWVLGSASLGFVRSSRDLPHSLHRLCRRLVRLLGIRVTVSGPVPTSGLIVCNHLSYVDIMVLAATTPVSFVAKREIGSWPIFGWFALRSGTIFVSREHRLDSARAGAEIRARLDSGGCVVLFPEGTSSDGDTVLPFKSSLLEPAVGRQVTAAALRYHLPQGEGHPAEDICFRRGMTLPAHLIGLLGLREIRATLAFDSGVTAKTDRKTLAAALEVRVRMLKESLNGVRRIG